MLLIVYSSTFSICFLVVQVQVYGDGSAGYRHAKGACGEWWTTEEAHRATAGCPHGEM